jgi:hypothetical protein
VSRVVREWQVGLRCREWVRSGLVLSRPEEPAPATKADETVKAMGRCITITSKINTPDRSVSSVGETLAGLDTVLRSFIELSYT